MNFRPSRFAANTLVMTATLAAAGMLPAGAQQVPIAPVQPMLTQSAPATAADRSFVTNLLQEARVQLAMAQLVRARSSDPMTLAAANDAVSEWSTLQGRLTALAIASGAPVRGRLDASERDELWQLGRTSPTDLRWAYVRDVRNGNTMAFNAFRAEEDTNDSRVAAFIDDARPLMSAAEVPITSDLQQAPSAQTATVDIWSIEHR